MTELSFEEWLEYCFGSTETPNGRSERWHRPPAVAIDYFTRAFENAAEVLAPYSVAQLASGFWKMNFGPLTDESVPWEQKRQCVRSMYTLFAECFASRCDEHLCYSERTKYDKNPLNGVCYMWWESVPMRSHDPAHPEETSEYLDVMRRTLLLDSDACQESALHGLGHWHWDYGWWRNEDDPEYMKMKEINTTVEIIDDFLSHNPKLQPDLKRYALAARHGRIQ
ncbi:MAG: hypothetical protein ACRYFS_11215 [Janthinobacterium lividum]